MIFYSLLLCAVSLFSGILAFYLPHFGGSRYRLSLVFAGSYLLTITLTHLIPNLFIQSDRLFQIGFLIWAGFFVQHILDYFSSGAEHGHIHVPHINSSHPRWSTLSTALAMSLHAFSEGAILVYPEHVDQHVHPVLWGILLHKAPETFALMTILLCDGQSKVRALVVLILFSLMSPAGWWLMEYFVDKNYSFSFGLQALVAIVCGNFLHVSISILFESGEGHRFHARKLWAVIGGAFLAIVVG